MWFLIVGLLLGVLYLGDVSPVASWHWFWILLPFLLAVLWWAIADGTGLTQRRAIEKMEARKVARRQRDMEALGLDVRREGRVTAIRDAARRANAAKRDADGDGADPPRRDPRP